jgi:hypothetical protein
MDDSSVRRSELPRVYPNPGSNGSMVNRDRLSETVSSASVGRCAISISLPSPHHPLFDDAEPLTYPTPTASCFGALRGAQRHMILFSLILFSFDLVQFDLVQFARSRPAAEARTAR